MEAKIERFWPHIAAIALAIIGYFVGVYKIFAALKYVVIIAVLVKSKFLSVFKDQEKEGLYIQRVMADGKSIIARYKKDENVSVVLFCISMMVVDILSIINKNTDLFWVPVIFSLSLLLFCIARDIYFLHLIMERDKHYKSSIPPEGESERKYKEKFKNQRRAREE